MAEAGWQATVLTLFPEMFPGPLGASLAGKSLKEGIWSLKTLDIRQFARDKHRTVDDVHLGGGVGMVLKPDVVAAALNEVSAAPGPRIYLTPRVGHWTSRWRGNLPKAMVRYFCVGATRVLTSA